MPYSASARSASTEFKDASGAAVTPREGRKAKKSSSMVPEMKASADLGINRLRERLTRSPRSSSEVEILESFERASELQASTR